MGAKNCIQNQETETDLREIRHRASHPNQNNSPVIEDSANNNSPRTKVVG